MAHIGSAGMPRRGTGSNSENNNRPAKKPPICACQATLAPSLPIAIEPMPDNLSALFANLSANGWVDCEVHPVGLAETPGLATLYGADTGASLTEGWAGSVAHGFLKHTIALNTLDNVLGDRFAGALGARRDIAVLETGKDHAQSGNARLVLGSHRVLEGV